ncbi:MAG: multiprotein bridging factor aMBF1 [Candidatus Woesearchaeota archaeon]
MVCDMCGTEEEEFNAVVEGTELRVCSKCAKYGEAVSEIRKQSPDLHRRAHGKVDTPLAQGHKNLDERKIQKTEIIQVIVPDYAAKVKNAREEKGMTQEDAAKLLNEKESILHKIERGDFEPGIDLARKLEKFFRIKLVEQHEEKHDSFIPRSSAEGFTVADFIKKRKG